MTETAVQGLSVAEAINTRRSIRKYTEQSVPDTDLHAILRLAGRAPSAWNLQPWRFVAVRDPQVKSQLQEAAYGQGQVGNAPVVIVLYSDMADTLENVENTIHPGMSADASAQQAASVRGAFASRTPADTEAWGAGQSYIALGYLSLAARSLGYDTSLMLGFDPAKVKALLNLPEHVVIPALIPLGVAAEEGFPTFRHEVETITRHI